MPAKLHKWHRRIGLLASLFIVFLVLTGLALQHSDDLKLPTRHVTNTWLLNKYGIKPNPIITYQLGNQTISHAGDSIYLSGKPIDAQAKILHGAIIVKNEIVVATSNSLLVIDNKGNLLDEISTRDGLVESPLGISQSENDTVIIRGITKYWEASNHFTDWNEYRGMHPHWVAPTITLPALKQVIEKNDMSRQISLERFLLDAHSGRFFGQYGIYVIDAAAIMLLLLAFTGIWLWASRR